MADRDLEISNFKDKIQWLENKNLELQNQLGEVERKHKLDLDKLNRQKSTMELVHQKNGIVEDRKEVAVEDNKCRDVGSLFTELTKRTNNVSIFSIVFIKKKQKDGKWNAKC